MNKKKSSKEVQELFFQDNGTKKDESKWLNIFLRRLMFESSIALEQFLTVKIKEECVDFQRTNFGFILVLFNLI